MIVYRASSGEGLTLDTKYPLGAGGEAQVLPVLGQDSLAAKIYHSTDRLNGAKLGAMIGNPPDSPDRAAGHALIAWPIDLLADAENRILGFLMPRVKQMRPLIDFYNPDRRQRACPGFNYFYLHRMALNLATAFKVLHDRGYVIGDVNQLNVLGNERALVTLVDADSFQVTDATGRVFRCAVGTPEFTPPELAGKSFAQTDRTAEHDRFGLAVLIFQLLMEGVHPFDGLYRGAGDPPPRERRIAAGHFPHGPRDDVPYAPLPMALPAEVLDPALWALMMPCFHEGHKNPSRRPEAAVWRSTLLDAQGRLVRCSVEPLHYYGRHLNSCPWCKRSELLGGPRPMTPAAVPSSRRLGTANAGSPLAPPSSGLEAPAPSSGPAGLPSSISPAAAVPSSRAGKGGNGAGSAGMLRIPQPSRSTVLGLASLACGVIAVCAGLWALSPGSAGRATPALALLAGSLGAFIGFVGARRSPRVQPGTAISLAGMSLGLVMLAPISFSIAGRLWHPPRPAPAPDPQTQPAPDTTAVTVATGAALPSKIGDTVTNSLEMKLMYVPAGDFNMGTPGGEPGRGDDETLHHVKITKPFMLASTPVTQAQFAALMHRNPSTFQGDSHPVDTLSWTDAEEFCKMLSQKEGKHYRLPTEAEWEYACRAGTRTAYSFGDAAADLDRFGWFNGNSGGVTHDVATKAPNPWQLYDVHGNVWQWCADFYGPYPGDETDPMGPATKDPKLPRVLRGGSWGNDPPSCRSGCRYKGAPDSRFGLFGFRPALDVGPGAAPADYPSQIADSITNSLGMKFMYIPAGEFDMGTPGGEAGRQDIETLHHVKISKPFLMAATPVTQAQWAGLMGSQPSHFRGDRLPVEQVSWNEAVAFCQTLSQKEGRHYRLPTEAEWEYACRAGTQTRFSFGDDEHDLGDFGWYMSNGGNTTHDAGSKKPNSWQLYDMQGNVFQWCADCFGPYRGDETDPKGSRQDYANSPRAARGGSWQHDARFCRCGCRASATPDVRSYVIGFRVVLDP